MAAPGARLGVLALDASFGASLASMGDATCARCRVDSAFLVWIAIVIVIIAVPLQEISAAKAFAASLPVVSVSGDASTQSYK